MWIFYIKTDTCREILHALNHKKILDQKKKVGKSLFDHFLFTDELLLIIRFLRHMCSEMHFAFDEDLTKNVVNMKIIEEFNENLQ